MSLKAIHIVFITASILLGLFVGWWAWGQYTESKATADLVYAIAAGASVLGLITYGILFIRKLRNVSYL